jgi:beta-xylosidase
MVDSVMLWNEPNNLSHWNFEIDPDWRIFANMVNLASDAVKKENSALKKVLGGISPIDPGFIENIRRHCVLSHVDAIAVHGFPLDWNHWTIHEWPAKLAEIRNVTDLPLWVSEVGVSTFGAEEVQEFGLRKTAELLIGQAERIHWYSLYDLPAPGPPLRGIAKPKAHPTIAISTWDSCGRMELRSWRFASSATIRRSSESASGFILKTIGWKMPWDG